MSTSAEPLRLGKLDEADLWPIDPAIWEENLAALTRRQPELAERLACIPLPENWRAVRALDGAPTYRLEGPGGPAEWLDGTAAPRTRAVARLENWQPADRNVALTSLGTGAEAAYLLTRLSATVALFVFEEQWERLAAALRVRAYAAEFSAGRLWLVAPGDECGALERILTAEPGLQPPAALLGAESVSSERCAALKAVCEEVARSIGAARQAELAALAQRATARSAAAHPSLAILARTPAAQTLELGRRLTAAARECGWPAELYTLEGPPDVHPLRAARELARQRPTHTFTLNQGPGALPLELLGSVLPYYLDLADVPTALPAGCAALIAGTPTIADRLRALRPARLIECDCAVGATTATQVIPGDNTDPSGALLYVADRPDAEPQSCGIEQPTHRILWGRLREMISAEWDSPRPLRGASLLARLAQDSGVVLGSAALEEHFSRMIESVLIPAVRVETILRLLVEQSGPVWLIGRGWIDRPEGVEVWAHDWFERGNAVAELRPTAIVFAGREDPLTPALLEAGRSGSPVVLHAPGGVSLAPLLGGILQPGQHFESFRDEAELRRCLKTAHERPAALLRQLERTRALLDSTHTWTVRLAHLAGELGIELPASRGSA